MSNSLDLVGFRTAVESLKLCRRAELLDPEDGEALIEQLYVDPLPHDDVFQTAIRPNTTFLIGRKGTGKSTVFQRLQHELRKGKSSSSAYLDIKTIYESSQPDQAMINRLDSHPNAMSRDSIEKFYLYKAFLKSTIVQIQEELKRRIDSSIWNRIKETFTKSHAELFDDLDSLINDASEDRFISAVGLIETQVKKTKSREYSTEQNFKGGATLGAEPAVDLSASKNSSETRESGTEIDYSDVLIRSFDIKQFLDRFKRILSSIGIRHLYIIVDDFSELPEDAMKVVVDVLLAPLNNWSDEFIKFKIAAYPGRIYYGNIDRSKVDEVHLDLFSLFGTADVGKMEESAINFTRRLVESRLNHYCKSPPSNFFDGRNEDVWRTLFYASMANPRVLGYILHFSYQNQLIHGKPIGVQSIQDASLKYYEEKVASYFETGKFLHEAFSERCSIFSLKELLEHIVAKAKDIRQHRSGIFGMIQGRPPTSHFHVTPINEGILATLELNFFVTKYFEMMDREGRKVCIFALNFGLCRRYTISFGRPVGEREFRTYFIERVFDFAPLIRAFLDQNQEIVCDACGTRQDFEKLSALKVYNMRCPSCGAGTCVVVNLSKKYESMLASIDQSLLLPKTEIGILQTLNSEDEPKRPAYVAGELDCSYQLVGKRAKNLEERGLLKRSSNDKEQRTLEITELAKKSYFSSSDAAELNIPSDD